MIEVLFELKGRRVNPDSMHSGLQRAMLATYREALEARVGRVRCERHRAVPTLLCRGDSVVDLSVEVCGCCDQLLDRVESRLH